MAIVYSSTVVQTMLPVASWIRHCPSLLAPPGWSGPLDSRPAEKLRGHLSTVPRAACSLLLTGQPRRQYSSLREPSRKRMVMSAESFVRWTSSRGVSPETSPAGRHDGSGPTSHLTLIITKCHRAIALKTRYYRG